MGSPFSKCVIRPLLFPINTKLWSKLDFFFAICFWSRIFVFQLISYRWAFINDKSWDRETNSYSSINNNSSKISEKIWVVSVFPYNISWLWCFLDIEFPFQNFFVFLIFMLFWFFISPVIIINRSSISFFCLKSYKYRAWCLKFIEFFFILNFFLNFLFNFPSFLPFFIFYKFSSFSKLFYDFLVMKSKSD